MTEQESVLDKTRSTLLCRLKDLDHSDAWREFFDLYWLFIFRIAIRKGLTEPEAEDVTQEVMIRVAKVIPDFQYSRKRGSFKNWLSQIVRNIIIDHYRKRKPSTARLPDGENDVGVDDALIAKHDLEQIWDEEWRRNLMNLALKSARRRVSLREFQIFHLHVFQEHSARKTAEMVGVSVPRVYLAKLRAGRVFKQEYSKLQEAVS